MDERLPEKSDVIFDQTIKQEMPPQPPPQEPPDQTPPPPPHVPRYQQVATIGEHSVHKPKPPSGPRGGGIVIKAIAGLIALLVLIIGAWMLIPVLFPKPVEPVTLTYWGLWEDEQVMKPILDKFHSQHPTITVVYTKQDPKQYRERLLARAGNGTGPDLFRFHNSWTGMLSPLLLPISSDVMTTRSFQNIYYPVMAQDLIRNGALLGIPLQVDTLALFTNTEILKAAGTQVPSTWVDFGIIAPQITVKDQDGKIKTAGAALGTADNITHVEDIMSLLFTLSGVQLSRLGDTPQQVSDALKFYTSFSKRGDNVWDSSLDPSILAFSKGNLAMYLGYYVDISAIKAANPSLQFEVHSVPSLSDEKVTIASYWVEGISAKSKHPKEALLFLKYLTQKDVLEELYNEEVKAKGYGQLYPRKDMADKLKDNSQLSPFVQQASDAISTPFSSDTQDSGLNADLNSALRNAIRNSQDSVSKDVIEQLMLSEQQAIGKYGL